MKAIINSPIGALALEYENDIVHRLCFTDESVQKEHDSFVAYCIVQLKAYFSDPKTRIDIPFQYNVPDFNRKVLEIVQSIPVGKVMTYKEIADALNNPHASQAVGNANAQNPILILIPCHRVIGSDYELKGYAGGLERKQWLLEHEGYLKRQMRLNFNI
jgi:methylated-DNA-[protein]-cysteine S-methyltransferase